MNTEKDNHVIKEMPHTHANPDIFANHLGEPCITPSTSGGDESPTEWRPTALPPEEIAKRVDAMRDTLENEKNALDLPSTVNPVRIEKAEITITPNMIIKLACSGHLGDAELIAIEFKNRLLWDFSAKSWRIYEDGVWVCDISNRSRIRAIKHIKMMYERTANQISKEFNQESSAGELTTAQRKSDPRSKSLTEINKKTYGLNQRSNIDSAMNLASSMLGISSHQFDQGLYLFNVINGTLNLKSGHLQPHNPTDYMLKKATVEFIPEVDCPLFKTFLNTIFCEDSELISFMQRAIGYSLTGSVSADVLFFGYGGGSNGKSTLIEILESFLGDYFQKYNIEGLLTQGTGRDGAAESEKMQLYKSRFISVTEIPKDRRLNEALVKDLTGGDTVTACAKYCMPVSFRPTHKLWLFGNDKPVIKGTDTGIWRRIMLIPFNHSFPEEGQQGWRDKEEVLKELRAELPGILNWAIDGYREYKSQGLNPPEAVLNAVKQYRSESDVLNEFIDDHFDLDTDGIITRSELWEQYMKYTEDDDRKQFKSRRALYEAMASRDFKECKSMGIRGFKGLKLKREGS